MGMSSAAHLAPTLEEIETLARAAIGRLPDIFRSHLDGVVLRVEEFPDSEVIAEMGLESPFDILGLYSGRPVGDKSIDLSGSLPDMIHLYRRPILDEWAESGESLEALVTDRKSTRLNPVTNAHLVCRLLLEKKQ